MKTTLISVLLLTIFTTINSNAQETSNKYVKIIVNANTIQASQEIDQFIRTQEGVLTSRMDRRTGIYLGIYDSSNGTSISDFISWIEELGYSTKCWAEGIHGTSEPIKKLDRSSCSEEQIYIEH